MISLVLPPPPSSNRWHRHVGRRAILSAEARRYTAQVRALAAALQVQPFPPDARLTVRLAWYRGRRAGDLDKRVGIALDALQGIAYASDAQIVRIIAARFDDRANPRLEVTIEESAA